MEYVRNRQWLLPKATSMGIALLCLSFATSAAADWAKKSKSCQKEETDSEVGTCATEEINSWFAEAELREEVIVYGTKRISNDEDQNDWLVFDENLNGWKHWRSGEIVAYIESEPEEEDEDPVKEKEQCLIDVKLEFDICRQAASHTHLMQYRACEAVHWSGWFLNFASRGRLGSVPDTCGAKLEINRDLNFARCTTNNTVNKILCE